MGNRWEKHYLSTLVNKISHRGAFFTPTPFDLWGAKKAHRNRSQLITFSLGRLATKLQRKRVVVAAGSGLLPC